MRNLFWRLLAGLAEITLVPAYTKGGYFIGKQLWDSDALDTDMSERVVLVTGANSGIGRATAHALADRGATVIMVCRNESRGEAARAELAEQCPAGKLVLEIADLSELASIRAACERIRSNYDRLDVLINNAGIMLHERMENSEGLEFSFATNVLSGFALTRELLPMLEAAAPSRVVHVSSGGMYTQRLKVDDLHFVGRNYDGVEAYAQNKRAQVILSEMWAQKLQERRVVSNSMHPGWAATPGVERSLPNFNRILGPILRTSREAADTVVWLAVSREAGSRSGEFFFDRKARRTHIWSGTRSTEEERARLWDYCEDLLGD